MGAPARLRWAVDAGRWAPAPTEFDFLLGLLPPEERAPCLAFRFPDDQRRALLSRLLQRAAATAALGAGGAAGGAGADPAAAAVLVARTKGGKPYLASPVRDRRAAPNFNYSVSHEGDYVVLASEPLCLVGCDVAAPQRLRRGRQQPLAQLLAGFERQLTPRELESIRGAGPDEEAQESRFRQLWSLKEAYVKATGEGLGADLGAAEFRLLAPAGGPGTSSGGPSCAGGRAELWLRGARQPRWAFHLHLLAGGHWAAVARGPLDAVVDAWGGFRATFQHPSPSGEEHAAQLTAPEPPFALLTVSDLVPEGLREAFAAAGGDVL